MLAICASSSEGSSSVGSVIVSSVSSLEPTLGTPAEPEMDVTLIKNSLKKKPASGEAGAKASGSGLVRSIRLQEVIKSQGSRAVDGVSYLQALYTVLGDEISSHEAQGQEGKWLRATLNP